MTGEKTGKLALLHGQVPVRLRQEARALHGDAPAGRVMPEPLAVQHGPAQIEPAGQ